MNPKDDQNTFDLINLRMLSLERDYSDHKKENTKVMEEVRENLLKILITLETFRGSFVTGEMHRKDLERIASKLENLEKWQWRAAGGIGVLVFVGNYIIDFVL
jgi:hypothetical protein